MSKTLIELSNKYGFGLLLAAATLDGYRRQVINDRSKDVLTEIARKENVWTEARREEYRKLLVEHADRSKHWGFW